MAIPDLVAIEALFNQIARSIEAVVLNCTRVGRLGDTPVLWLEVEETETLRHLRTRVNQELAERFPNTQAPFDGPAYHFHLTITLGRHPSSVYQTIATELASREVMLRATARHLVLFYYDDDQISLGSFLTYKILPLGKTSVGLSSSHNW